MFILIPTPQSLVSFCTYSLVVHFPSTATRCKKLKLRVCEARFRIPFYMSQGWWNSLKYSFREHVEESNVQLAVK